MTEPIVDLSIVIPSYETEPLLARCLEAVAESARSCPEVVAEVIVVDNGSRDGSADYARRAGGRVVAFARNRGFAAAVNAGLRLARGRHALLLNSDALLTAEALRGCVAVLDAEPRIGIVGPALAHPDGRHQRSVHVLPGLDSELLGEAVVRRLRGVERDHAGPPQAWREVEAVRGAVFFIRGAVLQKIGPFDEGFFFFLEETDYCARVRAAGHHVAFVPDVFVPHALGASSKDRAPLATRIEYQRSLDRALRRHRGALVAALVRWIRCVRAAGGVLLAGLAAPFSARDRRRLRERSGLVLWHLRGRPSEPELARALLQAPEADDSGATRGERAR